MDEQWNLNLFGGLTPMYTLYGEDEQFKAPIKITELDLSGTKLFTLLAIDWTTYPHLKILNVSNTGITFLKGCPRTITKLNCSDNRIDSLEGCPEGLFDLNCDNCDITSFKYCPLSIGYLSCKNNNITSFEYCPPAVMRLNCENNDITNFLYAPNNAHINALSNNLSTLQFIPITKRIIEISPNKELIKIYGNITGSQMILHAQGIRRRVITIWCLRQINFCKDLIKELVLKI